MNASTFLQDLAVVMMVAGLVTLLFHRLKQPVVLGYLLAGLLIGPYTPPVSFISDEETIRTMADLGVVFLMFSLGLDFNLRKLSRVGLVTFVIAAFEILAMILCGYLIGSAFGWGKGDCLFLGIMLSLTSTMIVVKSLRDRDEINTRHAELVAGVSLFDDMFVILLMVLLPGFARTGSLPTSEVLLMLSGLFIFLVGAVVVGLLLVPRLMRYISRYANEETLLIVSLGLCFALAMLAVKLQFSAALGAFLIGAVVAEAREVGRIRRMMEPLRDMFCAVFFVAIGMQIDPRLLLPSLVPAVVITAVYMVVKVLACASGAFLVGTDARTSMKFGANMAQIGEFAFILATLGFQMGLTSDFLYPMIVSIASLNAFVRPYVVDNAERIAGGIGRVLPEPLVHYLMLFRRQAGAPADRTGRKSALRHVWSLAFQLALNLALIAGGFLATGFLHRVMPGWFDFLRLPAGWDQSVLWLLTAVLLLPVYIATFRKMQAMSMMLAEVMSTGTSNRLMLKVWRTAVGSVFLLAQLAFLVIVTLVVSAALLPPWQTLTVMAVLIALLVYRFGRAFNRWYSEGKFALIATLQTPHEPPSSHAPLPGPLHAAHMQTITIKTHTHGGRLIRELGLRTVTGASIVALERHGKTMINPSPDMELLEGDHLLVIGDSEQLVAAAKFLGTPPDRTE